MTQIRAHLMEKTLQLTVPKLHSCFSWLNKETLWPLRYPETFPPPRQITKIQNISAGSALYPR